MNLQRRQLMGYGGAAALATALPLRTLAAAASIPARSFDTVDLDWSDERRRRAVPVRFYLPHQQRPMPLVVFSHGIGGSRRGYSWLGQHFARHGIASVHMQHVGSDNRLWSGNVFNVFGRLREAAHEGEAMARAIDLRFTLDKVLAGELASRIDPSRIIAAGHSYGANTALLASGALVERDGRAIALRDERVRAAIVISAPPFYGEAEPRKILQNVTVPSLHITCTDDIIRIPGYYSGAEDRVAVFDATGSARKWLTVFQGGSHSMFTDRVGTGGLTGQVKAATQNLSIAFVNAVLSGEASELANWPRHNAAILARFSAVGA